MPSRLTPAVGATAQATAYHLYLCGHLYAPLGSGPRAFRRWDCSGTLLPRRKLQPIIEGHVGYQYFHAGDSHGSGGIRSTSRSMWGLALSCIAPILIHTAWSTATITSPMTTRQTKTPASTAASFQISWLFWALEASNPPNASWRSGDLLFRSDIRVRLKADSLRAAQYRPTLGSTSAGTRHRCRRAMTARFRSPGCAATPPRSWSACRGDTAPRSARQNRVPGGRAPAPRPWASARCRQCAP